MSLSRASLIGTVIALAAAAAWAGLVGAWMVGALPPAIDLGVVGLAGRRLAAETLYAAVFGGTALVGLAACALTRRRDKRLRLGAASVAFVPIWQASVYAADRFDFPAVRAQLIDLGLGGLFLIGLAWLVWYVERHWNEQHRSERPAEPPTKSPAQRGRIWNPLHPRAWYYGRHNAKLHQSLALFANYALLFFAACMLAGQLRGCQEMYELPAGGGKQTTIAQTVKIQKVIRKKFVINPFSSINMNLRSIDDVKLQLVEMTAHQYAIGQGEGQGAGFGGGTASGKVRFIRLEYAGGDWDQDFGIGADLNMLIQYGVRTSQKIADQTESRTIGQLENFPAGKSPPLMYLTGQKSISLSKSEVKTLREYLLEKQGMLFIDNGGSQGFHNQSFAMMRQVLPEVEPVKVPLDDVIHRVPYGIPFLPYVAPHGGRDAWGWKVDGRWVGYYHPGDIGDAWSDGHSGVRSEVWEACYQLGVNVMFYAHAEYGKWLMARQAK